MTVPCAHIPVESERMLRDGEDDELILMWIFIGVHTISEFCRRYICNNWWLINNTSCAVGTSVCVTKILLTHHFTIQC